MAEQTSFEMFGAPAAVAAALRTGLLAAVAKGPASDAALSRTLGLDPRALALVLDLLQAEGLVVREGPLVAPGKALLATAREPGGSEFSLKIWAHAEDFLRTGEPLVLMDGTAGQREEAYRSVVAGLAAIFEGMARDLAARLPLRPRAVLDVGCGSGVWGLAFAERHAEARVTGLDLPAVLKNFDARAAALGLGGRVKGLPGDMHAADIPAGAFDLAILANVLRLEAPERASALVRRVAAGVAPGGSLLVVDAVAEGTPERERARALYALHLGMRTRSGHVHRAGTVSGWLAQAGLPRVETIDFPGNAGNIGGLLARKD